jgi:GAF domain-containing protein
MQDMDLLGLFARQAAIAIHQLQQYDRLGAAIVGGLRRLANESESPDLAHALDMAGEMELDDNILSIADQFNRISQMGEAEQEACLNILRAFGRYARAKTRLY